MRALIFGIGGQDGAYLAQLLLGKGYEVVGTSRSSDESRLGNLNVLGIRNQVHIVSLSLMDPKNVLEFINASVPNEIYNLAGQTSVSLSFNQPIEALESISVGTLNILEAFRVLPLNVRLFNACSSECFGNTDEAGADEQTLFKPRSPYAIAKAAAYWQVSNYRSAYDIHASSGIMFNHESPLRPYNFVTRKIVRGACRIAQGKEEILELGNLEISRDWGWAPDYVEAMWRMLQQDVPEDYVIASGQSHKLSDFLSLAFERFGLDWRNHVIVSPQFLRPIDVDFSKGNPAKAANQLGWHARTSFEEIISLLVDAEMAGNCS